MKESLYIDKIISSLRKKLDEDDFLYRNFCKGELIKSKVVFHSPLKECELDNLKKLNVPEDYINFLRISNGAELFIDDYKGSLPLLKLYSLDKVIEWREFYKLNLQSENEIPIGLLADNCDLIIDERGFRNGKSYLALGDGSQRFEFSFQEWLDKFIICQGNEFWLFNNLY